MINQNSSNQNIVNASIVTQSVAPFTTAVGSSTLSIATGMNNTAVGYSSLMSATNASGNTVVGASAATGLLTGTDNVILGNNAGSAYTEAESSNILIGNTGTTGESNIIRIGTQGVGAEQQNTCYIAGISGTPSNFNYVAINTTTGQLGSVSSPNFITITQVSSSPYTVLTTDYFLAVNTNSIITIKLPNAPTTGIVYMVKDSTGNSGTNPITVTTVGGTVLIDGSTTYVINNSYQSAQFVFDGTTYEVF